MSPTQTLLLKNINAALNISSNIFLLALGIKATPMTSVYRAPAQHNTNSTALIPSYQGVINFNGAPLGDLSGSAFYSLDMTNVQYVGGSYYVDMGGVDLSGNPLNFDGQFIANGNRIVNINFLVDVPMPASYRPNLEFTIYFKNIPFGSLASPILTIGLLSTNGGPPLPYIYSPPAPLMVAQDIYPSITLKSDGTKYTVASTGPAGWLGPYLLTSLVGSISLP